MAGLWTRDYSVYRLRHFIILTAWPLASYSGHFCLILANSMLTCLLMTAMGFPPEHKYTHTELLRTWHNMDNTTLYR